MDDQLEAVVEVEAEEQGTSKKGRGRPRKAIVPHTLSPSVTDDHYPKYRSLYYTADNEMVDIKVIEKRIHDAESSINDNITQTALDIYFVKANWKTFYSRNKDDQFSVWLKNTIPLSRSYVWDLIKCVKELVVYQSGDKSIKDLDDLMLASVQVIFEKYDISLLREIIHLPKVAKGEYLGKLIDPKIQIDKATVMATKEKLKAKPNMPSQNVIVDHVLIVKNKQLLSLENLAVEDPALSVELEKAIERAYKKYIKNQGKN